MIPKLANKKNMVVEHKKTMCIVSKVRMPSHLYPRLEELYAEAAKAVKAMLTNRSLRSSKDYPTLPCVLSKSLISKYQRNKKCRAVKSLVLPVCGDKGKQVKLEKEGLRVPAFFKKEVIPVNFPKPIVGFIRGAEFFKRDKKWYCSLSYNTLVEVPQNYSTTLGVDRNSVGNLATIAIPETGTVRVMGFNGAKLKENYRNRRSNLQKSGKFKLLAKLSQKQSRRMRDANHKISATIVEHAKKHRSAIVLENLQGIRKGKARRYVEKSQWAFYQLEQFLQYKAALSGIPIFYVDARNTSKECSGCGSLNVANGKHYKCAVCGDVKHRDVNAAFNIANRFRRESAIPRVFSASLVGEAYATRGVTGQTLLHVESFGGAR